MTTYTFKLILNIDPVPYADELFEAGCDDALFGVSDGVAFADFDREADSFEQALLSALDDVQRVHQLIVTLIEPGDLVTASDIATRLERSRESVRLLAAGKRQGSNPFPAPVSFVTERNRLWRWTDVLAWHGDVDRADAELVAGLNAALELRRRISGMHESGREFIESILPVAIGTSGHEITKAGPVLVKDGEFVSVPKSLTGEVRGGVAADLREGNTSREVV